MRQRPTPPAGVVPESPRPNGQPVRGGAYALVLPFFIIFIITIIVPLVYSGYLSFFKKQLIGGTSFAGFANYAGP